MDETLYRVIFEPNGEAKIVKSTLTGWQSPEEAIRRTAMCIDLDAYKCIDEMNALRDKLQELKRKVRAVEKLTATKVL